MPGEAIQVGPFVGGLNTFSDETAIADNELVVCNNFELDLDGSLVSRPPIVDRGISFPLGATGNVTLLGYYYAPGNIPYLLASDGLSSTYYFNGTTWVLITNTFAATSLVQFGVMDGTNTVSKGWLLAPTTSSNPGGYWSPTGGFVAEANMPKGDVIIAHKKRLWVSGGRDSLSNPSRLYVSNVLGDVSKPLWNAPVSGVSAVDFINIGSGDGQAIVRIMEYYNSLVIFRSSSIYSFQYTTDPTFGTQSLLVPNIGLASLNSVVAWENYLYFIYDDKAYEFVNNRAAQINLKVPFESVDRTGLVEDSAVTVSLFNNRIIFSFWDVMYVFNIRTRTWTTWTTTVHSSIGRVIAAESDVSVSGTPYQYEEAICFSSKAVPLGGTRVAKTLHITDAVTSESEAFTCVAQTKNYNYQASSVYKRLFWWGADAIFRGRVTAAAVPITWNTSVIWNQMHQYTWNYVLPFDWNQPANPGSDVTTIRDTTGSGSERKFVKFLKSLRFRQIHFKLTFETNGSTTSAPVRLFSLMTYVRAHEKVSKTVT